MKIKWPTKVYLFYHFAFLCAEIPYRSSHLNSFTEKKKNQRHREVSSLLRKAVDALSQEVFKVRLGGDLGNLI